METDPQMYWLSHAIRTCPAAADASAVRPDPVQPPSLVGVARAEAGTQPDRVATVLTREHQRIPADQLHALLQDSYWARGIPLPTVERALQGSLCMAVLAGDQLLAFARAVTDGATFAWICDVIVHPDWRGRGLGKQVVSALLAQPELQGLRRLLLATADAHTLYQQYGFSALKAPERWLERHNPAVYQPTTGGGATASVPSPIAVPASASAATTAATIAERNASLLSNAH